MPSVPFARTKTASEDTPWNWDSDTQNKILGSDGDNWADYKAAHAWWDGSSGEDSQKKAPYKLPHHRMGDDGLEAVWHGVSNAVARLSQADIPDDEMKSVFDHLTKHYAQWDKTPPDWDRFLAIVHTRQKSRAIALPLNATRAVLLANRPKGSPIDSDMPYIQRQMRTPITNPDQLYVLPAAISDQQVDSYFTRMTPLTLSNFADGATRGVSVCDSHNHEQMPIGRSFMGQVASTPDGGLQTQALAYLIRGMQLPGGMRSDDYIQALEGGIYHDVSVGFDPQHYWCSVCQLDMLNDWDCNHWPGRIYEQKDGDTQCIADVDADLVEYSPVYKASNPGAYVLPNDNAGQSDGRAFVNVMVLKAQAEMERGRASNRDLMFVEDRCRVRLFSRFNGYTPAEPTQRGVDISMPTKQLTGADIVAGVIRRAKANATRAGKSISNDNMQKLNGIQTQLAAGHGTIADAIAAMGDFIISNGSVSADPDNDGDIDVGPVGTTDDPDNDGITVGGDATSGLYGTGASTSADGTQNLAEGAMNDGTNGSATNNTTSGLYGGAPGTVEGGRSAQATTQSRLTPAERDALNFAARMRDEAIAQALKAGARAMGQSFNQERYQAILSRSNYDEILAMKADWDAITARNLSPIGTQNAQGVWSTEPTGHGSRQTSPQDPNNPVGLPMPGATTPARAKVNPNQYKA